MRIVEIDKSENKLNSKTRKVEPIEKSKLEKYNKEKHKGLYIDVYA